MKQVLNRDTLTIMGRLMNSLGIFALMGLITMSEGAPTNVPPSSTQSTPNGNNNPVQAMFRNFMTNLPPYANPFNYFPNQEYQGFGAPFVTPFPIPGNPMQFPYAPNNNFGQQFIPGQPPYGQFGVPSPAYGVTPGGSNVGGSFAPTGQFGVPNPAYGVNSAGSNVGGSNVPIVTTRLNQPGSPTVYSNSVPVQASVSVQGSPDRGPVFRSQTVQGPNSYGTAYAYASG